MTPRDTFYFAFDDSGGIEPLLKQDRTVQPGQFPFAIIAAAGINTKYYPAFCDDWRALTAEIGQDLGLNGPAPIHARLMFGNNKPPKYRGNPNPYLSATHEQASSWFLRAARIFGKYGQIQQGGMGFMCTADRASRAQQHATSLNVPQALAEGEFLKLAVDRKHHKDFHRKYIAHVTAALIAPTFDTLQRIHRTLEHCSSTCEAWFDSYTDSAGFDDAYIAGFIRQQLQLTTITSTKRVTDVDAEPLCQAADVLAYIEFRKQLFLHRQKEGLNPPFEEMTQLASTAATTKGLCAADVNHWADKQNAKQAVQKQKTLAHYASAHYELSQYAPEFVAENLKTLAEFAALLDSPLAQTSQYLPILKDGVLDAWQASRI